MNRLLLSAQVLARGALRSTPAGLPALDATLQHASAFTQDGRSRHVTLELKARAIGELAHRLAALELGSAHEFAGFLGCQRNGRGVVFHVTEIATPPAVDASPAPSCSTVSS